jgi:hypothetical protein
MLETKRRVIGQMIVARAAAERPLKDEGGTLLCNQVDWIGKHWRTPVVHVQVSLQ